VPVLWCLQQKKFRKLCKSAVFCGLQGRWTISATEKGNTE